MISRIKLIRNIGAYNSVEGIREFPLNRLVLVYAENGRGKTTLTAILRSLAAGDSQPIVERRRIGSQHPPQIVLECTDNPSPLLFQGDTWNRTLQSIKVFDDAFVDANVHSGLSVEAKHRQNLHEVIIGDRGIELSRRLQNLVDQVEEHNSALREKSKAIPPTHLNGLSVDEFCDLPRQAELDVLIETTQRELAASKSQGEVLAGHLFDMIELPGFDVEQIEQILKTDLPGLDRKAEERVQQHLKTLGAGGEQWIAAGMRLPSVTNEEKCPFCNQSITGQDLIAHYRAYFSEGYSRLKEQVGTTIERIRSRHSGGAQAEFEREVRVMGERRQFWSQFCEIPLLDVDTAQIVQSWSVARDEVMALLSEKRSTPLEPQAFGVGARMAVKAYEEHRQQISNVSGELKTSNSAIRTVKERAEKADPGAIADKLARLQATKSRYSDDIAPLCEAYLQEKQAKSRTEVARDETREELATYRDEVFPALQGQVNEYLPRFNAGFRVSNLAPVNSRSGSACNYSVVINDTPVAVSSTRQTPDQHSFRNTLSAGDRNTLALAFFFSSLNQIPNLGETIVVLDDPVSSLDEHRSLATAQEVRRLIGQTEQVFVLSHDKGFLVDVFNGANANECSALEVIQQGSESNIKHWDVSQSAKTEHDIRYALLQGYANANTGNSGEVARAIRPYLEGILRVLYPAEFPPGKMIGPFLESCRQKSGSSSAVMPEVDIQELKNINEYARQFHHGADSHINNQALLGYVKRALAFGKLRNR